MTDRELLELEQLAYEWAVALDEIHAKVFIGPGPHQALEGFRALEQRLHDLAISRTGK